MAAGSGALTVTTVIRWWPADSASRATAAATRKSDRRIGATDWLANAWNAKRARPARLANCALPATMATLPKAPAKVRWSPFSSRPRFQQKIKMKLKMKLKIFVMNWTECRCYSQGSASNQCDLETGQCQCRDRFVGKHCNRCRVINKTDQDKIYFFQIKFENLLKSSRMDMETSRPAAGTANATWWAHWRPRLATSKRVNATASRASAHSPAISAWKTITISPLTAVKVKLFFYFYIRAHPVHLLRRFLCLSWLKLNKKTGGK